MIDHQETPSPLNPLGIKGAGEAGVIPGTAAIASAIEDAVGRRIAAMPISPTELYDLMRNDDSERTAAVGRRVGNRSDGVNLDGSAVLHADPERVWSVITDPAVLARTIPGCESLEQVGDDEYKMNVTVGVGRDPRDVRRRGAACRPAAAVVVRDARVGRGWPGQRAGDGDDQPGAVRRRGRR